MPADDPPNAESPASGGRCTARTKAGGECRNRADGGRPFCLLHDPERVEERRQVLSQRGRNGQAQRAARERETRADIATAIGLGTAAEILGALERALADVQSSGGTAIDRANAIARVCATALQVLRTAKLEDELDALRAEFEQRFPDARGRLGALDS